MKNIFSKSIKALLLCLAVFNLSLQASNADFSNQSYVRLQGHVREMEISESALVDNLDGDKPISMTFILPLRN